MSLSLPFPPFISRHHASFKLSHQVYAGLDDLWLERASGQLVVDLVPHKDSPRIDITLSNSSSATDSGSGSGANTGTGAGAAAGSGTGGAGADGGGLTVRLKAEGFRLVGDKGLRVPPIRLASVSVTAVVRVGISLVFNARTKKWSSSAKQFRVELLSFKGPVGLGRTIVGSILSLVVPMLRQKLVDVLPHEFGSIVKELPSPLRVRGEFTVTGVRDLGVLTAPLHKSAAACGACGMAPKGGELFYWLQRSMERPAGEMLKTIAELLAYRHQG